MKRKRAAMVSFDDIVASLDPKVLVEFEKMYDVRVADGWTMNNKWDRFGYSVCHWDAETRKRWSRYAKHRKDADKRGSLTSEDMRRRAKYARERRMKPGVLENDKARAAERRSSARQKGIDLHATEKTTTQYRWTQLLHGAKLRDLEVGIDESRATKLFTRACFYCRIPASPFNGVDRYDNELGYTVENCVPCCTRCNRMKSDMSVDDFFRACRLIAGNAATAEDIPQTGHVAFRDYKYHAKLRGIPFALDKVAFSQLISQNCRYCGLPRSGGVDRANNDHAVGYTGANAVPCCKRCNAMKSDMDVDEFLWLCTDIHCLRLIK